MHHEFWLTEADHRLVTERLKGTPTKTPTVQTNSQKLFSALSVVERCISFECSLYLNASICKGAPSLVSAIGMAINHS